ncbi:hypothetical protein [Sanguibacteroides sp. AM78-02pH3A]|uniref:hypothetical protein n=1 Tax=Sanguibacteroides sp. AM78-02pH3A TaxID=3002646 RepID=UPI0022DE9D7B|nr:hypothetical protein [Sanguibacteroides sp. AM78-02pH3A]
MKRDFTVVEKVELKPFKTYDGLKAWHTWIIDGSLLYVIDHDPKYDLGTCYDFNTGKKLSVLAKHGKAPYELSDYISYKTIHVTKDFIVFVPAETMLKTVSRKAVYTRENAIKVFAKKDMINNVPVKDRKVIIPAFPDSVWVEQATILPNGAIVAIMPPPAPDLQKLEKDARTGMEKKTLMVLGQKGVTYRETLPGDGFPEYNPSLGSKFTPYVTMKRSNARGLFRTRGNDMAVFAVDGQFMLYTFDVTTGKVVNEKRYTPVQYANEEFCFLSTNDMRQSILAMEANDSYIVCKVGGYFNAEDKEYEVYKEAIFVFDWNLNPIKRFDLPDLGPKGYFSISNDARSVYFNDYAAEEDEFFKLTLHKADLAL